MRRVSCVRACGVAEGDATVFKAFEAVVGERDVVDVAREVARRMLPAADLLHVDRPGFLPHARIDHAAQARPDQGVAHLRAKDRGERVARQEEPRVRGLDPRRAVGREPPGGDEEVRMRMVLHGARPGVEDRHDAERAADPRAIVGERLDGRGSFAQERGVDELLV